MTKTTGPEMARLHERLYGDPDKKCVNFHADWGPEAHKLTVEERAKVLNDAMDRIGECRARGDVGDGPPMSGRPKVNVRDI